MQEALDATFARFAHSQRMVLEDPGRRVDLGACATAELKGALAELHGLVASQSDNNLHTRVTHGDQVRVLSGSDMNLSDREGGERGVGSCH